MLAMEIHDRGRLKVAVTAAIAVAVVGLVITTGFVFAGDDPTGEDVFDDVQERYENAESVSADALVTVESDNETASVETQIAATADGQVRLNLSGQESYLTAGTDGDTVWVYEPQTDSSVGLAETDDDALRATLRAGTVERTVSDSVPIDDVSPGDTVGEVLEAVDEDELPDEWQERIEELPRNATLAELAAEGEFDDLLEDGVGSAPGNDSTATDVQSQVVADRLLAQLTGAISIDAGEIVGALNGDGMAGATNETGIAGVLEQIGGLQNETGGDGASVPDGTAQLTAVLGSADEIQDTLTASPANRTVELVGTTTVDGEETHELLVTSSTNEYDLRLWADTETDELRKVEWTGTETTITAEIRETRFDVSPAGTTFEAPGAVELASVTATNTTTSAEFATDAPFDVRQPEEPWTFERGSTVELETSFETGTQLDDNPVTTVARYTESEQSLLVVQSSAVVDVPFGTETVSVGNTTARLTELGDRTIGVWAEEGTTTVVVGDLSEDDLQSVIETLS